MNKREEFEKALSALCKAAEDFAIFRASVAEDKAANAWHEVMALFDAAQPSQDGLPELPAPNEMWTSHYSTMRKVPAYGYTDDQMLAYGAQCRAAALEQAAQIVEREAMPSERPRFGVAADAIRALAAAPIR